MRIHIYKSITKSSDIDKNEKIFNKEKNNQITMHDAMPWSIAKFTDDNKSKKAKIKEIKSKAIKILKKLIRSNVSKKVAIVLLYIMNLLGGALSVSDLKECIEKLTLIKAGLSRDSEDKTIAYGIYSLIRLLIHLNALYHIPSLSKEWSKKKQNDGDISHKLRFDARIIDSDIRKAETKLREIDSIKDPKAKPLKEKVKDYFKRFKEALRNPKVANKFKIAAGAALISAIGGLALFIKNSKEQKDLEKFSNGVTNIGKQAKEQAEKFQSVINSFDENILRIIKRVENSEENSTFNDSKRNVTPKKNR